MVATRGRTFKRPWRRSCLSSKLKSSSAPIGRKDSWCFHAVGSSNAPLLGSTAAEGLPRIGRTSIATRWRSCGLPQSASCSENFVIPPDVFGQTLRDFSPRRSDAIQKHKPHKGRPAHFPKNASRCPKNATNSKRHACKLGFEGIVPKRLGSPYVSGRSRHWIKNKNPQHPAVKREAEEDWAR